MSTVPSPAQERTYPLPAPAEDSRFTLGLVFDVGQVLVDHGYPPITAGGDLVALQQALYRFLYRPAPADHDDGYAEGFLDGSASAQRRAAVEAGGLSTTEVIAARTAAPVGEVDAGYGYSREPEPITVEPIPPYVEGFRPSEMLVEPAGPDCMVDVAGWCGTHEGYHPDRLPDQDPKSPRALATLASAPLPDCTCPDEALRHLDGCPRGHEVARRTRGSWAGGADRRLSHEGATTPAHSPSGSRPSPYPSTRTRRASTAWTPPEDDQTAGPACGSVEWYAESIRTRVTTLRDLVEGRHETAVVARVETIVEGAESGGLPAGQVVIRLRNLLTAAELVADQVRRADR